MIDLPIILQMVLSVMISIAVFLIGIGMYITGQASIEYSGDDMGLMTVFRNIGVGVIAISVLMSIITIQLIFGI